MQSFPVEFLESWQFRKIESLHSRWTAISATTTLLRMYAWANERGPTLPIPERQAMAMVEAYDRRHRRRVLAAMCQANVIRRTEFGYLVWALQPLPTVLFRGRVAAQIDLPLDDFKSGSKTTFDTRPAVPDAEDMAAAVEEFEQNQALSLARACDMSATQGDDAPLIDPASNHTEFLQAPNGERSEAVEAHSAQARVLLPWPLKSVSEKQQQAKSGKQEDLDVNSVAQVEYHSRPMAPSGANAPQLRLVRSTVVRPTVPPRWFIEGAKLPQRVKARCVITQQKLVVSRKHSSAASAGQLSLKETVPMLRPCVSEVVKAASAVWTEQAFPLSEARRAVDEMSVTRDELDEACKRIRKRIDRGQSVGPWVLLMVVGDIRKERAEKKGNPRPAMQAHPRRSDGDNWDQRRSMADSINAWLGKSLKDHHCLSGPCLDLFTGATADDAVSLYAEMNRADPETTWDRVAEKWSDGLRPRSLGQRPERNDEARVKAIIAELRERLSMPNVQTVDNARATG